MGSVDIFEATEILIVLVETTDDQFDGVVGVRDDVTADGIEQLGPMALEEIKDRNSFRDGLTGSGFLSHNLLVAFLSFMRAIGVEDLVDLLFELLGFGMLLRIIGAVEIFDVLLDILQSVKNAGMVLGIRKDLADEGAIILA